MLNLNLKILIPLLLEIKKTTLASLRVCKNLILNVREKSLDLLSEHNLVEKIKTLINTKDQKKMTREFDGRGCSANVGII